MRLARVTLRHTQGLPDGLELAGFGPGLNLVLGPNTSGKTTLCRAVRASLWAGEPLRGAVEVEWVRDGQRLVAQRVRGQPPTWTLGGGEGDVAPPRLPDRHLCHCWSVELDDLLGASGAGAAAVASALRLELSDGQDLGRVLVDARRPGQRQLQHAKRTIEKAERAIVEIEEQQRGLAREEQRLSELNAQYQDLLRKQRELRPLEDAHRLAQLRVQEAGLRVELDALPSGMERVSTELLERRDERRGDLELARRAREAAQDEAARLKRELDELGLSAADRSALGAEPTGERAETLERLERELDQARASVAEAAGAVGELARGLASSESAGVQALDRSALDRLDASAEGVTPLRAALAQARVRVEAARAPARESGAQAPPPSAALPAALLALALGWLAVVALLDAMGAGQRAALVAIGLVAALLAGAGLARAFARAGARGLAQERAARAEAERERAEAELIQAQGELDEVEAARRAVLEGLGIDPEAGVLAAATLGRRLAELDAARAKRVGAAGRVEHCEVRLDEELSAAAALLAAYGRSAPESSTDARAALAELAQAARRSADLARRHDEEVSAARSQAKREVAAEAALAKVYSGVGLEPGDDAGLELRVERLDAWRKLSDEARGLRAERGRLEAGLGDEVVLADRGVEALAVEIEERIDLGQRTTELLEEIKGIEATCDQARRGHELEVALDDRQRALEALAQTRDELELAVVAEFLLDEVSTSHQRESQPALVRRAAAHFARFTGARYELGVTRAHGADELPLEVLEDGRAKAIPELSAGTRAQLLLALRLAVAEAAEVGEALPLFLDEVLATSDAERFDAIVAALGELGREGRQVVHLTSDADEAQRFDEALVRVGFEPAVRHDLARAAVEARRAAPLARRAPDPLPDPAGHTPESYLAALEVPALDPFRTVAETPLAWVLADELEALFAMLRAGATTVARARRFHEERWTDAWDAPTAARFEARADALAAFLHAWRVGRGRPLDEGTLRDGPIGARSTKIDEVVSLAAELGWDARALVEALRDKRVKRFDTSLREDAEAEWAERGFYDPREPLDLEDCIEVASATLGDALRAHRLTLPELREWCERWWRALEA